MKGKDNALKFLAIMAFTCLALPVVPAQANQLQIPDTPYLPIFPGYNRTVSVASSEQPGGGIAYTIKFETADQPVQVLNWFRDNFKKYNWVLDTQNKSFYSISAQHGSSISATITLSNPTRTGSTAHIEFIYCITSRNI